MLVGADARPRVASKITTSIITTALALVVGVATASSPVAAGNFSCAAAGSTYAVRSGDSWYRIANNVAVSVPSLLDANSAALEDVLLPGDRLCLPSGATGGTAATSGATGSATTSAACASTYTVASGDSWYRIAYRAGVSPAALLSANGAKIDKAIHPGNQLCLPSGAKAVSSSGATASAAATNTSASTSASGSGGTYTVQSGDSWSGIAAKANVTMGSLLKVNGASATKVIIPGDVITLPAGATQPPDRTQVYANWVDLDALPVQGPCWYHDTWRAPRPGGRSHEGVDYFTKPGDYVYAVADGKLTYQGWEGATKNSGNAWKLTTADGTYFFYAHLKGFAPGLGLGSPVTAGQIIGWVGQTGNATVPHLHFEIHPKGGAAINPYPVVQAQGGCNKGTPYTQPGGWVPELIG